MTEHWRQGGFGLYVHWPFCEAKCPYCDFNSHVVRKIDHTAWQTAYLSEIDRAADLTPNRVLNSVFFGGGTPSLMQPSVVGAILDRVASRWTLANDLEVTLEANPTSVEADKFAGFSSAGVNRISMGIQALNDADLRRLGRRHSVEEARNAFTIARNQFARVSFDLIYARQDQTLSAWEAELTEALTMSVDHLSLYQLTIEDGTAFGDRFKAGKLSGLPDSDLGADMYDLTQDVCEAHGMPAYEVSNHAREGVQSRHNMIYWSFGDYVGIGPGAHGRLTLDGKRFATEAKRAPQPWLADIGLGHSGWAAIEQNTQDIVYEYVIMCLRTNAGIDLELFRQLSGNPLSLDRYLPLIKDGLLIEADGHIRTTRAGRMVLNQIINVLTPD